MSKLGQSIKDPNLLAAALEGLELQKKRIEEQIQQVRGLLGVRRGRPPVAAKEPVEAAAPKRELSSAARKRIALAQKRRWAAYRKQRSVKPDTK
jgi:hypothetical protein